MRNRLNAIVAGMAIVVAFAWISSLAVGQGAPQAPAGQGGGAAGAPAGQGGGAAPGAAPAGRGAGRGGGGGARANAAPAAPAGPTPRLPNGKPDLSGHWNNPYTSNMAARGSVVDPTSRMALTFPRQGESFPNSPPMANGNAAKTFDLPYTAFGLKHWLEYDPVKNGDYTGNCLPFGFSRSINAPRGLQIIQNNDAIAFLFEQNTWHVWIPTNGVKWPANYPTTWNGQSTGRWEGDTLIVETDKFNGYTRLDTSGHPHSRELKLTNTFLRTDSNTIQHTVTVHDPKAYTQDWMNVRTWRIQAATNFILEYACEENNTGAYDGSITPWRRPTDEELDN